MIRVNQRVMVAHTLGGIFEIKIQERKVGSPTLGMRKSLGEQIYKHTKK